MVDYICSRFLFKYVLIIRVFLDAITMLDTLIVNVIYEYIYLLNLIKDNVLNKISDIYIYIYIFIKLVKLVEIVCLDSRPYIELLRPFRVKMNIGF